MMTHTKIACMRIRGRKVGKLPLPGSRTGEGQSANSKPGLRDRRGTGGCVPCDVEAVGWY